MNNFEPDLHSKFRIVSPEAGEQIASGSLFLDVKLLTVERLHNVRRTLESAFSFANSFQCQVIFEFELE